MEIKIKNKWKCTPISGESYKDIDSCTQPGMDMTVTDIISRYAVGNLPDIARTPQRWDTDYCLDENEALSLQDLSKLQDLTQIYHTHAEAKKILEKYKKQAAHKKEHSVEAMQADNAIDVNATDNLK